MHRWVELSMTALALASVSCSSEAPAQPRESATTPPAPVPRHDGATYTAAGELVPPSDYRSWTFVTSGFAMAYGPAAAAMAEANIKAMDNVFVPRAAYEAFGRTGIWPDGTIFVLEVRTTESTGSIVDGGHYQSDLAGLEVHVVDARRFEGGSGFFAFDLVGGRARGPAKLLPRTEACYDCHTKNGAVGDTFTQFYPTLFPVGRAKGTVRADFVGIPPTPDELVAEVEQRGWSAAERMIDDTTRRWPAANLARESALNRVGYQLLAAGKQPHAIAAFEYTTRRHPGSANAWDSLSEAHEAAGRRDEARTAVDRGLAALDRDPALAGDRRDALERALRGRKARLAVPPGGESAR